MAGEDNGGDAIGIQLEGIRGDIRLILNNQERGRDDLKILSDRVHGHSQRFQIHDGRFSGIDNKFAMMEGERLGVKRVFTFVYLALGAAGTGGLAGLVIAVLSIVRGH